MIQSSRKNSKKNQEIYLALNSGTSMDGVDACLFDLSNQSIQLLGSFHRPYCDSLKRKLIGSIHQNISWFEMGILNNQIAEEFSLAALSLLKKTGFEVKDKKKNICLIASHGQTIYHCPKHSVSIQLGNPNIIAHQLGIDVIADFRKADLAAGGQGAPLAPIFHQYLLTHEVDKLNKNQSIAVINLGGIGNITILKRNQPIIGYDFGPANTLIDQVAREQFNQEFDDKGELARSGKLLAGLLKELKKDNFFKENAPKSTGIEYFSKKWLNLKIAKFKAKNKSVDIKSKNQKLKINSIDLIATLTHFSADLICRGIDSNCKKIYLTGGGVNNLFLVELIRYQLNKLGKEKIILATIEQKLPAQSVECALFAFLAKAHLEQRRLNTSSITGAKSPKILGNHYPA